MVKIWAYAKDPQWQQRVRHAYTIRFGQDLLYLIAVGLLGAPCAVAYWLAIAALDATTRPVSDLMAVLLPIAVLCLLGIPLGVFTSVAWRWLRCRWSGQHEPAQPRWEKPRREHLGHFVRSYLTARQTWLDSAGSLLASMLGLLFAAVAAGLVVAVAASVAMLFFLVFNVDRILFSPSPDPTGIGSATVEFFYRTYEFSAQAVHFFQLIGSLVAILATPWVLRLMAWLHYTATRAVFTFDAVNQKATQRVTEVESSRASSRAAQSEALRRLERNIHDGPQQQLVRLGIDVTRARKQTHSEPESAVAILDDCAHRVQSILTDLRDLSRGIAPPILSDRGLVAAARELAAQSAIPAVVTSEIAPGTAIPYFAEETAYFVISEALANANKHSQATSVTIHVASDGDAADSPTQLTVRVIDNGCGGAHPSKGRGLAGLADRVAGAEGILTVDSPITGPTLVKASVPCAW